VKCERDDGLRVLGGQKLHGAEIDSSGDHRIAVATLRAEGETVIHGAESARSSLLNFSRCCKAWWKNSWFHRTAGRLSSFFLTSAAYSECGASSRNFL
jgi:hypothetical protein